MSIEDYFYSSQDTQQIEKVFTGAVLFNTLMNLSPDDQAVARFNIGAGKEDRNYGVIAYYETEAELPSYAETGDSYGVRDLNAYGPQDIVTELISTDGVSQDYELSASPNGLIKIEELPGEIELTPLTDYIYSSGIVSFTFVPAAGSYKYRVSYISPTATPVYNIFSWDSIHTRWINTGPMSVNTSIISDNSDDLYHVLSSKKTREIFNSLHVGNTQIDPNSVSAEKIVNGAVSTVFTATISTNNWYGAVKFEYLSPDGATQDFTLDESPSDLIKLEFVSSGTILTPGIDYVYSSGVIHFAEAPGAGIQTYEVDYYSTKPPFTQSVEVLGLLGTDTPVIDVVPSSSDYSLASNQIDAWDEIYKMVAEDDALLVYSHWQTLTDIPIKILCVRK